MTLKTSGSLTNWLALGTALLAAVPACAQALAGPASDTNFADSLASISVSAAKTAARQKADAAEAAKQAATPPPAYLLTAAEQNADGWGATANPPVLMLAARVAPDSSYTPGHLCNPSDPNFKEYRYAEHIPYCNRNVTQQMKQTIAAHYGVPQSDWSGYEFDHLIPLAIGGDSSIDNLWPQPHGDPDGSNGKDKLEDLLYREMAAGTITQAAAVQQIYGWFTASSMAAQALQVTAR